MTRSSLVQRLTAEALRAVIRAVGYVRETPTNAQSLPRALFTANVADGLAREFARLAGFADLLLPISTFAESFERQSRLERLDAVLPELPPLRDCIADGADVRFAAPLDLLRGTLVAADEMQWRAVEEKLSRNGSPDPGQQRRQLLELLHAEAAVWRTLENSRLANALVADRGFLDTYASAKKRAREVMKNQLRTPTPERAGPKQRGKQVKGLKLSHLRDCARWQRSIVVQLDLLAGSGELQGELAGLAERQRQALGAVATSLTLARLARVLPKDVELAAGRGQADAKLINALQGAFNVSKANYRAMLVSQLG